MPNYLIHVTGHHNAEDVGDFKVIVDTTTYETAVLEGYLLALDDMTAGAEFLKDENQLALIHKAVATVIQESDLTIGKPDDNKYTTLKVKENAGKADEEEWTYLLWYRFDKTKPTNNDRANIGIGPADDGGADLESKYENRWLHITEWVPDAQKVSGLMGLDKSVLVDTIMRLDATK